MANVLDKNPIILDTVGEVLATMVFVVKSIQWSKMTTVDHQVKLSDSNGNVMFQATCKTAGKDLIKYFLPNHYFKGLNLITLGSGEVHIIFDQGPVSKSFT